MCVLSKPTMSPFLICPSKRPVSRIALVSPERSKEIETILLKMAQSGQLRGQVTEEQLIDLLDQVRVLSFTPLIKLLKFRCKMEEVKGKATGKKSTIIVRANTLVNLCPSWHRFIIVSATKRPRRRFWHLIYVYTMHMFRVCRAVPTNASMIFIKHFTQPFVSKVVCWNDTMLFRNSTAPVAISVVCTWFKTSNVRRRIGVYSWRFRVN